MSQLANMYKTFEKFWVSLLDSKQFRKFTKANFGVKIFKSDFYRGLRLTKNKISTRIACIQQPELFKTVRTFVFFVGHNKSGTSMIGSLLDAHPNAIVSDEVGALDYLLAGFSRDQVFHLLLRGSRREYMKGRVTARRLTPYSYLVPGQWQGKYRSLTVMGDGKAGSTTKLFADHPQLLKQLPILVNGPKIRIIQIIRNPFDVISVMMVRGNRSFENSIAHFFYSCEILKTIRENLEGASIYPLRYEDFVEAPKRNLELLCGYLGLEPRHDYLEACRKIIHDVPVQHRQMVGWESKWIELVEANIKEYDFLEGYSFE